MPPSVQSREGVTSRLPCPRTSFSASWPQSPKYSLAPCTHAPSLLNETNESCSPIDGIHSSPSEVVDAALVGLLEKGFHSVHVPGLHVIPHVGRESLELAERAFPSRHDSVETATVQEAFALLFLEVADPAPSFPGGCVHDQEKVRRSARAGARRE